VKYDFKRASKCSDSNEQEHETTDPERSNHHNASSIVRGGCPPVNG